MAPLTVKLPDGSDLELDDGASGADAAAEIGPGLAKAALALRVDGELRDLSAPRCPTASRSRSSPTATPRRCR